MFQIPEKSFSLPFLPPLVLHLPIPLFHSSSAPQPPISPVIMQGVRQQEEKEEGCWGFLQTCREGEDVCVCVSHSIYWQSVFVSLYFIYAHFHILPMYGCKQPEEERSSAWHFLARTIHLPLPPCINPPHTHTFFHSVIPLHFTWSEPGSPHQRR